MRILIVGTGAVGGYFAARLQAHGRDVTLLVRERRAAQLRKTGLVVYSPHGDVTVTPKLVLASELAQQAPFDVIILSTKAYQLEAAMEDFAPAVSAGTAILPLLNGMRHLEALSTRFGAEHVLGGSSQIVSDLDSEGRIHQFGPLHDLVYGERDKSVTPRIQAIDAAMQECGFPARLAPDVMAWMWRKWVLLSSLAATTCLLRGSIGQIEAVKYGVGLVHEIIDESAAVAAANHFPQEPPFMEAHKKRLTEPGSALTASMFRDLSRGTHVEVEHILGDFLAHANGTHTPLLTAAYVQLKIYENALQT